MVGYRGIRMLFAAGLLGGAAVLYFFRAKNRALRSIAADALTLRFVTRFLNMRRDEDEAATAEGDEDLPDDMKEAFRELIRVDEYIDGKYGREFSVHIDRCPEYSLWTSDVVGDVCWYALPKDKVTWGTLVTALCFWRRFFHAKNVVAKDRFTGAVCRAIFLENWNWFQNNESWTGFRDFLRDLPQ